MEREYKAFISYRHLPLDMAWAKRVHREIEHFTVPKALRKNGGKRLGIVFRDQDELPLSSSLSDSIRHALDHTEFLIVICTPETAKSMWVLREISYFMETHDRDHVLAVLADGTPETSFPDLLTARRGENGEILEQYEPLAANVAAPGAAARKRLFKTERLRIFAALLGCAYDDLYQREQRYKRRRAAAATALAGAVAAAFIGMLLNRNAEIGRQLRIAQLNESKALAQISRSAYESGDLQSAVRYAVEALPSETGDRPFSAEAERQLARALSLYKHHTFVLDQSFEQESSIERLELSEDGKYAVTADALGAVRAVDTYTGKQLWQVNWETGSTPEYIYILDRREAVLLGGFGETKLFSLAGGQELCTLEFPAVCAVSPEQDMLLGIQSARTGWSDLDTDSMSEEDWAGLDWDALDEVQPARLCFAGPEDGAAVKQVDLPLKESAECIAGCFSGDGRYAAVLLEYYAHNPENSEDIRMEHGLCVCDTENGDLWELDADFFDGVWLRDGRLCFTQANDLVLACATRDEGCYVSLFSRDVEWGCKYRTRLTRPGSSETGGVESTALFGSISDIQNIDFFACGQDMILLGSDIYLFSLDESSGEMAWRKELPSQLKAARLYDGGVIGLMLYSGAVTQCGADGEFDYSLGMYTFAEAQNVDIPFSLAGMCGQRYQEGFFAAVTGDQRNRVVLIKPAGENGLEPVLPESLGIFGYTVVSPTGQLLAGGDVENVTWVDTESGRIEDTMYKNSDWSAHFSMGSDRYLHLTGDRKIIVDSVYVYDMDAERFYPLTESGEKLDFYSSLHSSVTVKDIENGAVVSAVSETDGQRNVSVSFWKDGQMERSSRCPLTPGDFETVSCEDVGGNGVIEVELQDLNGNTLARTFYFSGSGNWTEVEMPVESTGKSCLGNSKPYFAVQDGGNIVVTDLSTGEIHSQISCDLPASSMSKLTFARGDSLLLVFSQAGSFRIYDTETGELLHDENYGIRFSDQAIYDIYLAEKHNELLLIYDEGVLETTCICIDMESWACSGVYSGVEAYLPETDRLLLRPALDGVYVSPFLSTEEITALGRAYLAR